MSETIVEQVMSAAEWAKDNQPAATDVRSDVACALDVYCLDHYGRPWSDISGDPETAEYSDAHGYVLAWALFTVEVFRRMRAVREGDPQCSTDTAT